MPLTDWDAGVVDEFRTYIDSMVTGDERYGDARRHDAADESILVTRFELGSTGALEYVIHTAEAQVEVAFLTPDRACRTEIEETLEDFGQSLGEFVAQGFADAGLTWPDAPVEHVHVGEEFRYATPIRLEELDDLNKPQVRDRVLRMLEGYLIAFGTFAVPDEE